MEVIPAIDLKGGRCVRLYQGDYRQETVFSEDPVGTALLWQSRGAQRLHLVDLDGAAAGAPRNLDIVRRIAAAVHIPVQMGGGIRSLETVRLVLQAGAARAILGTAAVEDMALVESACREWGDAVAIGIDARDGRVATHGWRKSSAIAPAELLREMAALGARRFIYTDIRRDGTLTEPNFEAIAGLLKQTALPIIASGGVATLSHLRRLAELGVEGAIVGKALYTGDVDLAAALQDNEGNCRA